jgi:CO dehydrogenase maturation factor
VKVAFAGKGGAGKTTLAALFIKALAKDQVVRILAVDCDPVANLGRLLGMEGAEKIAPVAEMKQLINERMEVSADKTLYKLNPSVDDIPDKFSKKQVNIRLIVMGTVKAGGSGCMCPESNFLKALLARILLSEDESIVMDMEAGVEHLGRGTAGFVDSLFIISEPNVGSVEAAKKIRRLALDIGIKNIGIIANKIKGRADADFVKKNTSGIPFIGEVPFEEKLAEFEKGKAINIEETEAYCAILKIKNELITEIQSRDRFRPE